MRKIFFLFCIGSIALAIYSFKSEQHFEPVAVIELFTSQGCSSCPSADQLLSQTIADAKKDGRKIIALSFHVDYWNRLGWADPFSDKKYSERQSEYASQLNLRSVYTPQTIVNGSSEMVGSDANALEDAVSHSLKEKTTVAFKTLTATQEEGKPIHLKFALDGSYSDCKINFALVSINETTIIKRGENGGRTLKNENVVRQFLSVNASNQGELNFASSPQPLKNNTAVISFVQRTNDLKIIGAAMVNVN